MLNASSVAQDRIDRREEQFVEDQRRGRGVQKSFNSMTEPYNQPTRS